MQETDLHGKAVKGNGGGPGVQGVALYSWLPCSLANGKYWQAA